MARTWGPLATFLAFAGLGGTTMPAFPLAPTLVTTTSAVATAMAFGLFGRRRRDDEPIPDDVLAAAAATGLRITPSQLAGRAMPVPSTEAVTATGDRLADAGAIDPGQAFDDETLLPRWRRPSLLQARKADPIRDSAPAARLTFGEGLVGPLAGRERRTIRYRVVRLLDSPDELRGAEIGFLDQGDEVQLLEKYGAYWLVASPDGQQGWLHKMVLGESVEADEPNPRCRSRPCPPWPTAGRWANPTSTGTSSTPISKRAAAAPEADSPCAARGRAGGRCWGRTPAGSHTGAGASRPGTR